MNEQPSKSGRWNHSSKKSKIARRRSPGSTARNSTSRCSQSLIQGSSRRSRNSPPWAFEGVVSAIGPVERIERGHVLVREGEVEDLGVLLDAFAVRRLGDHDQVMLQGPAQQHLCWRASDV